MISPAVSAAIQATADALFVPWLLILLFGSGFFLTLRYGVVQIRRFRDALKAFVASQDDSAGGALSPFQAFMTALAATIGTGNIAGVAAGIVSGGPGALFWRHGAPRRAHGWPTTMPTTAVRTLPGCRAALRARW